MRIREAGLGTGESGGRPRRRGRTGARRGAAGFTIIELMVAIVVILGLAAVVGPNVMELLDDSTQVGISEDLKTVEHDLLRHKRRFGVFPSAIAATGTSTASSMVFAGSPNVGLYVEARTATSISLRSRSTQLRSKECRRTITYGQNSGVTCTDLATEWTGADPGAA